MKPSDMAPPRPEGPARILLVEDSEHDARFFMRVLEKAEEPCEVRHCVSGEQALEALSSGHYDLLISDLNMPGMDGLELIRRARPLLDDTGALILTGSRDVHSAAEAVRLQILDYILKEPREALRENLLPQISSALRQVRLMRENRRLETELQHRLEHLEQIYQELPDSLFATVDKDGVVLEINEQARELLGLDPSDTLEGRSIATLLGGLSESLSETVEGLLTKGREVRNLYVDFTPEAGGSRLFCLSLKRLDEAGGESAAFILVMRDITPAVPASPMKGDMAFHGLVGRDPAILDICQLIRRVAPLPTGVLITGPTGSGKEVVARAIHEESDRSRQPYIAVNCTALSSEILESELFGHVRGAFTGALNPRKGRFREADGGTLFLDEIGDTTEMFQAKLLRALDSGQIEPVGQDRPVQVNVRVICATNKDLEKLVREGRFREDLYFRINIVHIRIPPLAQRIGDLPLLVEKFRQEFNQKFKQSVRFVAPEAMRAMAQYDWPGNVRELRHVMERAFVVAQGPVLGLGDLPPQITGRGGPMIARHEGLPEQFTDLGAAPQSQDIAAEVAGEEGRIRRTLAECGGNIGRAAAALNMHRTTLWRKMRQHGIEA